MWIGDIESVLIRTDWSKAVITGTRISVELVLHLLAAGYTPEQV